MPEKMSEVYGAYDMEVLGVGRGRGAVILKTDKGIRQLTPLAGNEIRLTRERTFKDRLYEAGFIHIDRCVENKEGELVTWDRYGNPYVLREYFEGRECSPTSIYDLSQAVENLAIFHIRGRQLYVEEEQTGRYKEPGNIHRKTQELKKIRSYISGRPDKCEFELIYMKEFQHFYNQALECQQRLAECSESAAMERMGYCHGAYNHHSILICDNFVATVNFDRFHSGYQMVDLYQFIRKIMEKNNYNFGLAVNLLDQYDRILPLNKEDYRYIYMLYSFPEKFWKISNRYMNSRKSWISPVNLEKLEKVMRDEQEKQKFLRDFSYHYGFTS